MTPGSTTTTENSSSDDDDENSPETGGGDDETDTASGQPAVGQSRTEDATYAGLTLLELRKIVLEL